MADQQSQPPKKEKKGAKKLWKKVKDFFKDKPTTATTSASTASTTAATAPTTSTAPADPKPDPASTSKPDELLLQSPKIEVDDAAEDLPSSDQPTVQPRPIQPSSETGQLSEPEMRFNKAQAIFAKYNLELSEADWDMRPKVPYERVAKNIRMRVRYTCHNCSTTFGHERVCVGCQHRRCGKCTRYPAKKDKSKATKPDTAGTTPGPSDLTQSKSDGTCHECQTGFSIGTEECPNCHHKICSRCLQEATVTIENAPESSAAVPKPPAEGLTTGS